MFRDESGGLDNAPPVSLLAQKITKARSRTDMTLFSSRFSEMPADAEAVPGSVTAPAGFRAAGIAAGLKKSGRLDLGLLISDAPCVSAALYTPNAAAAAPILVCREETEPGGIRAVVVNSGSANACTGAAGLEDAREMVRLAAAGCGIGPANMAVASTGVIGVPLDMQLAAGGIAAAAAALSIDGGVDFAEAIRTTDSIDKQGAIEVALPSGAVRIGFCAKGAGMIAPNMATMLAFVTTDAGAPPGLLKELLAVAAEASFNSISVDGDMSTNDCLFLLANGRSGVGIEPGSADAAAFAQALAAICKELALKMVADGEGATKVVELNVAGAATKTEAVLVARTISTSPLVRTAFYGGDANWGRLMASAGSALAGERELRADIYYEEVCLAAGGAQAAGPVDAGRLAAIMAQPEISVTVDLHRGAGGHTMYFSDLTHEYVTINSEYTT